MPALALVLSSCLVSLVRAGLPTVTNGELMVHLDFSRYTGSNYYVTSWKNEAGSTLSNGYWQDFHISYSYSYYFRPYMRTKINGCWSGISNYNIMEYYYSGSAEISALQKLDANPSYNRYIFVAGRSNRMPSQYYNWQLMSKGKNQTIA